MKRLMELIIKIFSYISLLVLFLVAAFLVFYIVSTNVAKIKKTRPLISLFTIVSPSMEPNIKVFDVIYETRVIDENSLKVGDIITFYSKSLDTGGYTVTHRINSIIVIDNQRRYITKGDNNQRIDDGYVTFNDIVGKVHFKLGGLGKIQFFVSSKLGWVVIVLVPALLIILIDIRKLINIFTIKKRLDNIKPVKKVDDIKAKEMNKEYEALLQKAKRINKKDDYKKRK